MKPKKQNLRVGGRTIGQLQKAANENSGLKSQIQIHGFATSKNLAFSILFSYLLSSFVYSTRTPAHYRHLLKQSGSLAEW